MRSHSGLCTHLIRLTQPVLQFRIEITFRRNSDLIDEYFRPVLIDLGYSIAFDSSSKYQTTHQVRFSWIAAGESHSHLKHRARLLWNHSHWTAGSNHLSKLLKEFENFRIAPGEERLHRELATRMPKVLRDETLATFWAAPEWSSLRWHCWWNRQVMWKAFLKPNSA
jgi:hypothetical protein